MQIILGITSLVSVCVGCGNKEVLSAMDKQQLFLPIEKKV